MEQLFKRAEFTMGSSSVVELEAELEKLRATHDVSEIYTRVFDGQKIGPIFYWNVVQYYAYITPRESYFSSDARPTSEFVA